MVSWLLFTRIAGKCVYAARFGRRRDCRADYQRNGGQTAGDCLILREKELNMDSHRLWMTEATEEKAACIQALWSDWQGDDQLMAYGTEQYALLREIFNRFMAQISDADGAESITLLGQQAGRSWRE